MKYKIKSLFKADISKMYIIGVLLISILMIGGFFSYAMFTVSKEKKNAISIVTGNLVYDLRVDGVKSNTITINGSSSKEYTITLANPNNRKARFNFYYIGSLDSNVTAGYVTSDGINTPPEAKGINLEKTGASGSSNTYKIKVKNNSTSSKTITLGVSVGLDYNDLTLPSNGHLFEETSFTAVETLLAKVNAEDLDYNSATTAQKKEMWTHTHPATEQTESLIDYRYIGADPNNYVTFNNETWRIIGVFTVDDGTGKKEERLKLIRDESIGSFSLSNNDLNNWPTTILNYLLNPGYESNEIGGSLYWNGGSGACYVGNRYGTFPCDFTTTGLVEEARNMIDDALWYLGGATSYNSVSNGLTSHFYSYERGTTVYSGNDTSWVGKVGLMYPSDYGYATSGSSTTNRNTCLNKELSNWDSSTYSNCKNNDWLLYDSMQWTITPFAGSPMYIFAVVQGYISPDTTSYVRDVRPAVFLKSSVKILEGNGSSSNPYILAD